MDSIDLARTCKAYKSLKYVNYTNPKYKVDVRKVTAKCSLPQFMWNESQFWTRIEFWSSRTRYFEVEKISSGTRLLQKSSAERQGVSLLNSFCVI